MDQLLLLVDDAREESNISRLLERCNDLMTR